MNLNLKSTSRGLTHHVIMTFGSSRLHRRSVGRMPEMLRATYRSVKLWLDIRRNSPLPEPLKSQVRSDALRLIRSSRTPSGLVGYKISHRGADHLRYLFQEIFVDACYFFRSDNPAPMIIDCGSNIGMSILFFKRLYPLCTIVGFEPDPNTFQALTENVSQNRIANVDLHNVAVGNTDGIVAFHRSDNPSGSDLRMSMLPSRISGQTIKVPVRKLSSFIKSDIDLLKLDVEGVEKSVLDDLESSAALRRIKQIHLEYHHHIDGAVDNLSETLSLLERNGFGYQMQTARTWMPGSFQDVSIFAYRK